MGARHNYIPVMGFEARLSALAGGVSIDMLRFALAGFASILVGAGIRLIKAPTGKQHHRRTEKEHSPRVHK